jgi:hypothetical protein
VNELQKVTELFGNSRVIFKSIEQVDLKSLKTRKNVSIYKSVDTKSNYYAIFIYHAKSRLISKGSNELLEIYDRLVSLSEHNYKKRVLLVDKKNICSKSIALFKESGWSIKNYV